jgi:hypothetical protein
MWECSGCGKRFARRGQNHSCGSVPLESHFAGSPKARALFDAYHAALLDVGGPCRLSVAKTRIGFITGITFSAVMPRKHYLRAHILLLRKLESARFVRIENIDPWWVHTFEIRGESDIDDELRRLLKESYALGARGADI